MFGPPGGVYKYLNSARGQLDAVEFRPQTGILASDMKNDFRGFSPRRHALGLTRLFEQGECREDGITCLRRELIEELRELRLAKRLAVPQLIQFRHARRVHEGPGRAVGQGYSQYRIFDVYDVAEPHEEVARFLDALRAIAGAHKGLLLASAREIIGGRSAAGRKIGHHSGYLLGRKQIRPDEPMFVDWSREPITVR